MNKKKSHKGCSNIRKPYNNIEVVPKEDTTSFIGNDKGKITLTLKFPFTKLGKKVRKLFFKRMAEKE